MFLYILTFFVCLVSLHIIFNYNSKVLLLKKIPGPASRFFIGHALTIMLSPVELFRKTRVWASRYKDMYHWQSFSLASVNIYNPEDIEIITSSMKHHKKAIIYKFLKPWLRDGLLLSSGKKWQNRRKILTNAFHFNVLQKYYPIIEENDKLLLETLRRSNGEAVDIIPIISEYTLNTICETAMGTKLSEDIGTGNTYKQSIYGLGKVLVYRLAHISIAFFDVIFNLTQTGRLQAQLLSVIHKFTKNVIDKRRNKIETKTEIFKNDDNVSLKKKNKYAMLDLLLSAEKMGLIDTEGIQEEVDTFMFEGHDTTASGLTHCLLLLANEPAIQVKLEEELNQIFGNDVRSASMSDLSSMKYLECCIKESLRLYPPVHFISREITEETKLSNYTIPANIDCNIHIYDLHRREDLFENATKFDPDRFLPENSILRHNYAYIPFSAGPRNCIGQKFAMMEMKSILSSILREFKLSAVTKPTELVFASDLVLRSIKPIYIKFILKEK